MTTFHLHPHNSKPGVIVVDIFEGERLIGSIYPINGGIKVVSKYLDPDSAIEMEGNAEGKFEVEIDRPFPPALLIKIL